MVPMATPEEEHLSKVALETSWVCGEARDGLLIKLEYISKFMQRTFKTNVPMATPEEEHLSRVALERF